MNTRLRMALIGMTAAMAAALGAAAPAMAHHSFAMFDFQSDKTITGTVVQFDWTNPHTFIWLEAPTGPNGAMERWGLEGMSPNYLGRRGWTKTTMVPGDKVTVTFHPLKDGAKGGTYLKVQLANGKELINLGG
jgi:hypothetical protein